MTTDTQHSHHNGLDATTIREAFSHFPQSVVLIGAQIDGMPQGLVASTFTVGVSLNPPLVSFAVQHTSQTWPTLRTAPRLGVSLLSKEQRGITRQLASRKRHNRFNGVDISIDETGALAATQASAWMNTELYDQVRAGDHDIVILKVLTTTIVPGSQVMVFHQNDFKDLTRSPNPSDRG